MAALTTIAATAAVAGTLYSGYQTYRAGKAQRRAEEVQRRQREAEQARQRRAQIDAARRRRAKIVNVAAQTGTIGSSGELGSTGNVQAQLGGNLGFFERSARRASAFETFAGRANRRRQQASIGQAVGGAAAAGIRAFAPAPPPASAGINQFDRTAENVRLGKGGQGSIFDT